MATSNLSAQKKKKKNKGGRPRKADRALLIHDQETGRILMANTDAVYAIQCFVNGERRLTDKLTPKEALHFRQGALHLANFLTREYGLAGAVGGHVETESSTPPE